MCPFFGRFEATIVYECIERKREREIEMEKRKKKWEKSCETITQCQIINGLEIQQKDRCQNVQANDSNVPKREKERREKNSIIRANAQQWETEQKHHSF